MTKKLGIFVKNTSRNPIVTSLQKIKISGLPNNRLISPRNRMNVDAVAAIDKHFRPSNPITLSYVDASSYIAASTLSHLIDGWGYLANSVRALQNGNNGVSVHLGYYAELRAVMSFLATEGIGVFSNHHIGLNDSTSFTNFSKYKRKINGRYSENKPGTHQFAWDALSKWCTSTTKPTSDLLKIFKVKGFDFEELTAGFAPAATPLVVGSIAKDWLLEWAFDVQRFKNDRELRNFVSYRPQTISNFDSSFNFKNTLEHTYELFEVLSPSGSDPFHLLDRYLLRDLYNQLFTRLNLVRRDTLENHIEQAFAHVGGAVDANLKRLLLSEAPFVNPHLIFNEAQNKHLKPLAVISRAALLLRIATGNVARLLKDSGITKEELNFIWENYGLKNGFWTSPLQVDEFYKLWVEVEENFTDLKDRFSVLGDSPSEFCEDSGNIQKISQFNRAALWGI